MFTTRSITIALLMAGILLVFIGCGAEEDPAEKLIGTWEILTIDDKPLVEEEGIVFSNEWEFIDNGTWLMSLTGILPIPGKEISLIVTVNGIYTTSASTINLEAVNSNAQVPPELMALGFGEEELQAMTAENQEKFTGTATYTISGDTLTIAAESGSTMVFRRK
jgi:hypothetical protein